MGPVRTKSELINILTFQPGAVTLDLIWPVPRKKKSLVLPLEIAKSPRKRWKLITADKLERCRQPQTSQAISLVKKIPSLEQ